MSKPLVRIDEAAYRAWIGDRSLHLSRLQFDVLRLLVRQAGKVVDARKLFRDAWHLDWYGGADKAVQANISILRRKLGDDAEHPRYIETVRGVGFRFAVDAVEASAADPHAIPNRLDGIADLLQELAERAREASEQMRGAL